MCKKGKMTECIEDIVQIYREKEYCFPAKIQKCNVCGMKLVTDKQREDIVDKVMELAKEK